MSGASTLAPAHRAADSIRSRVSGGWLPGAVLVVGLAVVAAVVAGSNGVSIPALAQIQADGASTHEVGGTYVAGWISPLWNPFVDGRFRILTLIATAVYFTSVTAIGATLVAAIRGSAAWPRVVRVLAGFLPGYLIMLGPLQLLFAGVGYLTAAWVALVATPLVAIALHRRALAATATALRHDGGYRRRWLGAAAAILGILVLCGLHRLQSGRYFMVPDSIAAFLQAAQQQLAGGLGSHLVQWDQQSDEWIFSAPLMFTSAHGADYLFPLYAAQFVALASFACLVFGAVHSFAWRRPLLVASLATASVLAASPSIDPRYQIALIGGQNPMMWLGHPGRMIGVVGPWIALLLLGGARSRRTSVALLLGTVGLAFTTVSGLAYVAVALVGAGAWQLLRGRMPVRGAERVRATAVTALALLAIAAPVFVYWDLHQAEEVDDLGWILVAGAGAAVLAAILVALAAPRLGAARPRPTWLLPRVAAWVLTLAVGFVLSNNLVGNVADGQLRSTLASVLPGYGTPLASRGVATGADNVTFPSFTGQECSISGHCVSFGYFLAGYGVVLLLALATWLALGQRAPGEDAGPRRAAFLVTLSAFVCSFALVDWTGADQLTAWVLTRFVEIPYYALLAFAALALVGARNRVTAWAGGAVLVAWTAIPLAYSHVVPQLAKNASYLIGAL